MRGQGPETLELVHQSQVQHLCLAVVVRRAPSLLLRLPQHLPQDGASRLGGQEGVVKRRLFVGGAEMKDGTGAGSRGRFGARGVGRRGGLEEEGVWSSPPLL